METAANDPVDRRLWAAVVSAAKRKFTVYPSAYANGWAVQEYKRRGGRWREKAELVPADWPGWEAASKDEGLGKWFAERWVDISRTNADGSHPACGRPTAGMDQADYAKAYPKCVPASRAARMSPAEKKNAVARKRDADNATGTGKGQKPTMVSTQSSRAGEPSATAKDKDPQGGLSAAGRKKFGVAKGVTAYDSASEEAKKRWVRWALRFTKTPRPLKDDNGKPTRYALMFHAWGEPVPTSTGAVAAVHAKAVARAKALKMGQYEKADTFFFEHEWVPVPGQPAEVAVCDLCGVNRWSDEHQVAFHNVGHPVPPLTKADYADPGYMKDGKTRYLINKPERVRTAWAYIQQSGTTRSYTPAERARIMQRIRVAAARFRIDLDAEQAAVLQRLNKDYGPVVGPVGPLSVNALPEQLRPRPTGPAGAPSPQDVETQTIKENSETPEAQGPHAFMAAQFTDAQGQPRCRLCGEDAAVHAQYEPHVPVVARLAEPSLRVADGTYSVSTIISPGLSTWTASPRATSTPVVAEGEAVVPPESAKAFVTELNGHTLLTAPANVFTRASEKALLANEHFLWMQGRFVGAEKANRNGAFWSTGDLELGELSVRNGPLNWLHEARHVIGTIADTHLVKRDEQTASDLEQPYIAAASAIWRWIYPDEAYVIEQASDAGKLWYSMECISKEVACVGQAGCGARASYGEYLKGGKATCAHMRERSATRHFSDPTFLGGAVIVPPVRPGWAEADASVMRRATAMAEDTYDQAGRPDVAAAEWEQLMAQLVRYARQ